MCSLKSNLFRRSQSENDQPHWLPDQSLPNLKKMALPEPIYYVFSPHDSTVRVGIDVVVCKHDNYYTVSWWDTSHERVMGASHVMFNPDFFAFKRNDGALDGSLYFFVPMDLDIYNRNVKKFLVAGRDFSSIDEMIKAFRDTVRDSWE